MEEKKASPTPPPFRADNGKFLTEALFYETSRDRVKFPPVFTLKDQDHLGLRSLKSEYLRIADPTEYEFAAEVLGSFKHWNTLCALSWFKPHIEEWRAELDVKIRSEAAKVAADIMADKAAPQATRLTAAKFLSEQGYQKKSSKGRPKKADIERAAREAAETAKWETEDHDRIFGARVN